MPQVRVRLKERSYPVVIGSKIADRLPALVEKQLSGGRIFVFLDSHFYGLHGRKLTRTLKQVGKSIELVIPGEERMKTASQLNRIYDFLMSQKISRSDFILACGGGVVSDLVGYAAATTLRGLKWGIVSTTLLGMVDAAIGGKTGINHAGGKNLIGAIWQPAFVSCDIEHLMTLPKRQLVSGLGEVVKYGGLVGKPMLAEIEKLVDSGNLYNERLLLKLVHLSARYKAEIVATDERDGGRRMFLNLGHTFSHGIEAAVPVGRLGHGEALLIGLVAVCEMSRRKFDAPLGSFTAMVETLLQQVKYHAIDAAAVRRAMKLDKKRAGRAAKFILLRKPGQPIIVDDANGQLVTGSLSYALKRYKNIGG